MIPNADQTTADQNPHLMNSRMGIKHSLYAVSGFGRTEMQRSPGNLQGMRWRLAAAARILGI
jgi:hypothetical protein